MCTSIASKFHKLVVNPLIIAALNTIFDNTDLSFLEDILFFKPPGAEGVAAHQEKFYLACERNTSITVWTALDRSNKETGSLWACPGSQKESILPVEVNEELINKPTSK